MGKEDMNNFGQLEIQTLIHLEVEGCSLPVLGSQLFLLIPSDGLGASSKAGSFSLLAQKHSQSPG